MKKIILLKVLLVVFLNANCQNNFRPSPNIQYIEIKNGSVQESINPNLFISMRKIHFPITKADTIGAHIKNINQWSPDKIDTFVAFNYYNIVTDNITFSALISFLTDGSAKPYLISNHRVTSGNIEDFTIILNGKQFDVYYKYRNKFLTALINRLKSRKCDKKIVNVFKKYLPHLEE